MTMTPTQIQLVRQTWTRLLPIQREAGNVFYDRLFTLDPDIRRLFKRDIAAQGAMLMAALNGVVMSLDRMERVLPMARELAIRHVAWGVEERHYDTVGEALLWTLAQALADEFTPPVREAWGAAYGALADVMKAAAYPGSRCGAEGPA